MSDKRTCWHQVVYERVEDPDGRIIRVGVRRCGEPARLYTRGPLCDAHRPPISDGEADATRRQGDKTTLRVVRS